jgi:hypothetical protein
MTGALGCARCASLRAATRGSRASGLVTFTASRGGWIAATLLAGVAVGVMLVSRMGRAGS